MNKKGDWKTITKWAFGILVVILILIIVIGKNEGLLNLLAVQFSKLTKGTPKGGTTDTLVTQNNADIFQAYDSIYNAFNRNKGKSVPACYITYTVLPDNLERWRIRLTQQADGLYMVLTETVKGGTVGSDEKSYDSYKIPELKLCVLEGAAAKSFYDKLTGTGTFGGEFREVSSMFIQEDPSMTSDDSQIVVGGKGYDIEDSGILYRADKEHICFIPTHDRGSSWGCDVSDTLDDDCISNIKSRLNQCS